MFEHSVKVPRLYKVAAKIVCDVKEQGKGVKDLIYQQNHVNIKALYALVVETIQHGDQLDSLVRQTGLLVKKSRLDPWLARILMTELLWGTKRLLGDSKPIQTILSYQQRFIELLGNEPEIEKPKNKKGSLPRYVRVNTLYMTIEEAVNGFGARGWILVHSSADGYTAWLATVSGLQENEFMRDYHIEELLVFHPGTQFYDNAWYEQGKIILQDKASCLPAYLLSPPKGATVLDMCAAPGMKASHVSARMNNTGNVLAVERDQRRHKILQEMLKKMGAKCVRTLNKDVLQVGNKELPGVKYIMVDPSCTGSGIVDRVNLNDVEEKMNPLRIEKLASFQIRILRHALSAFPKAHRVVYSTCSLFPQENEQVVQQVLASCPKFKLLNASKMLKGEWFSFGSSEYENIGEKCLYARPDADLSNGFFVAVFKRTAPAEESDIHQRKSLKNEIQSNQYCPGMTDNTSENQLADNASNERLDNGENVTKKRKKHKKKKAIHTENTTVDIDRVILSTEVVKKRKIKQIVHTEDNDIALDTSIEIKNNPKKNKAFHSKNTTVDMDTPVDTSVEIVKRKKKKKSVPTGNESLDRDTSIDDVQKRKNRKSSDIQHENIEIVTDVAISKLKRKKYEETVDTCRSGVEEIGNVKKQKKTKSEDISVSSNGADLSSIPVKEKRKKRNKSDQMN